MKKLISKLQNFKAWIKGNYSNSSLGVIFCCGLMSWIVAGSIVDALFSSLNMIVNIFIAGVCVIVINELTVFLTWLILGIKRRSLIYSLGSLLFLLSVVMISSQSQHMGAVITFAILVNTSICLLGRSACTIIRNKKIRVLNAITLALSIIGFAAFIIFLSIDGFDNNYEDAFFKYAHENKQIKEVDGFEAAIAAGSYEVGTYSYGVKEEDIKTNTVDLDLYAERKIITGLVKEMYFDYKLSETPVRGQIWYPKNQINCPVLFIVHGNHDYTTPSYLGYEYLGEYLASHGYVVVSADENGCNDLSNENDARAVLFLENIKAILKENEDTKSPIYGLIDSSKICIAGHSRGGETAALAYLFNDYEVYPDNGNAVFDYGFDIKGVVAIAPTVDQYKPAMHAVELFDTNYLIIQGANDFDVAIAMGEKQYNNIIFTGDNNNFKAMLYIAGANHGQFNSKWGKYDLSGEFDKFLNIKPLITEAQQQEILKIYMKIFLDNICRNDARFSDLFYDVEKYHRYLPETLYQSMYQSSNFEPICSFDEDSDLSTGTLDSTIINVYNANNWSESIRSFWNNSDSENYCINITWENQEYAKLKIQTPILNIKNKNLCFDIADCSEETEKCWISCKIQLEDISGNEVTYDISDSYVIYPSWPVQLRKLDYLFNDYEYKHQMQTIRIPTTVFEAGEIDLEAIAEISFIFDNENGQLQIDNIGLE